jgi:hypothetical protein
LDIFFVVLKIKLGLDWVLVAGKVFRELVEIVRFIGQISEYPFSQRPELGFIEDTGLPGFISHDCKRISIRKRVTK